MALKPLPGERSPASDRTPGGPVGVVGVVGDSSVACGIAQVLAEAGFEVRAVSACDDAEGLARTMAFALRMIERKAEKGAMTAEAARAACDAIQIGTALDELRHCEVVIESALGAPDATRALVARLEAVLPRRTVIALNTSSEPVTALASGALAPERIGGLHFFDPVPLMRIVEVVPGMRTEAHATATLTALVERVGHRAVQVRDSPGFVVNHIGRAMLTEGLQIAEEQIAAPVVVDRIVRSALGLRMGPFELFDLIGIDVSEPVTRQLHHDFQYEPRLRPTPMLAIQRASGFLGRKTGRGFFAYPASEDEAEAGPVDTPPRGQPLTLPPPVWIDGRDAGLHERIRGHLEGTGAVIDQGAKPRPDSLCIVLPVGDDATTSAHALGLDARRTVAADALLGPVPHATLMAPPVIDAEMRAHALHLFSLKGPASWIHDSPGFVAQRILAAIVNTACDVAQRGLSTPGEIDDAVRLALGYPAGPLAMGDRTGAARILRVLDGMHDCYRDPRYRPSPWLRRRALLGISLTSAAAT